MAGGPSRNGSFLGGQGSREEPMDRMLPKLWRNGPLEEWSIGMAENWAMENWDVGAQLKEKGHAEWGKKLERVRCWNPTIRHGRSNNKCCRLDHLGACCFQDSNP